jgi:hypothetical protein
MWGRPRGAGGAGGGRRQASGLGWVARADSGIQKQTPPESRQALGDPVEAEQGGAGAGQGISIRVRD